MSAAAPPELQPPIHQKEIDELVEVEGDSQNGGGSFVLDRDQNGNTLIKFVPGDVDGRRNKSAAVPGEIGSPSIIGLFPSSVGFSGTIPPMGPPPGMGGVHVGGVGSGFGPGVGGGVSGGSNGAVGPRFGSVGSNANQFTA